MKTKNQQADRKKAYQKPTLKARGCLVDVTEGIGGGATPGRGVGEPNSLKPLD